ncbi:MAG: ATP-grasp domain-containing protein [Bacteroidota bacterium]
MSSLGKDHQEKYNDKKPKGRVIITSGRSLVALTTAHSLGKRGIDVIGTDCIDMTLLSFSKFVRKNEVYFNPLIDEEKFLASLEEIIKRNQPEDSRPYMLIPIFDETFSIARNIHRFEKFITVACPGDGQISKVHPKNHLFKTAQDLNLQVPSTAFPESRKELSELVLENEYPVLVKPYDSSGGRGIEKVYFLEELQKAFDDNMKLFRSPSLVQQYVTGEDYCLTVLFQDGQMKASMAYKNLHNFPASTGSGVVRETIESKPFEDVANGLLQPLKWNGIAQLDFLWDQDQMDQPCLIEVNPRFWAGLFQSVHSGVDYPWLNYLLFAYGEVPENEGAVIGVRTKIPVVGFYSAIKDSLNIEQRNEEVVRAGREALRHFKKADYWKGLGHLLEGFKSYLTPGSEIKDVGAILRDTYMAENELLRREDPWAVVGILYAFSYLIKYKEWPPEIRS